MNAMDRLRASRPAPAPVEADRDALFDRIVATPPSGPGARPARRRRKLVLVAAVGLAVTLTAGTAVAVSTNLFGWHTDNTFIKDPRVWRTLYRDATQELRLPPGMVWPSRTLPPHTITNRSEPGGMAVAISQTAWECYWTEAIRAGDPRAARSARAALSDLVRHHIVVAPPGSPENVAPPAGTQPPFEIYASDGGIRYVKHSYALAAAGDPSGVAQSCRANRGDLKIPPVR
jgi:hypothetical protein